MEAHDTAGYAKIRRLCACVLLLTIVATGLIFGATVVRGGSMYPTLVPGDVAIYRRTEATARIGDIVLYAKAGWPGGIVHRVVDLPGDGRMRTRGDANLVADRDSVAPSDVRGVVVAVVPIGRTCSRAAAVLP